MYFLKKEAILRPPRSGNMPLSGETEDRTGVVYVSRKTISANIFGPD
jgi:hypothetical protein